MAAVRLTGRSYELEGGCGGCAECGRRGSVVPRLGSLQACKPSGEAMRPHRTVINIGEVEIEDGLERPRGERRVAHRFAAFLACPWDTPV
jgi:hypothetical protein